MQKTRANGLFLISRPSPCTQSGRTVSYTQTLWNISPYFNRGMEGKTGRQESVWCWDKIYNSKQQATQKGATSTWIPWKCLHFQVYWRSNSVQGQPSYQWEELIKRHLLVPLLISNIIAFLKCIKSTRVFKVNSKGLYCLCTPFIPYKRSCTARAAEWPSESKLAVISVLSKCAEHRKNIYIYITLSIVYCKGICKDIGCVRYQLW